MDPPPTTTNRLTLNSLESVEKGRFVALYMHCTAPRGAPPGWCCRAIGAFAALGADPPAGSALAAAPPPLQACASSSRAVFFFRRSHGDVAISPWWATGV